jgi:phosphate transport system substrate-binding protein
MNTRILLIYIALLTLAACSQNNNDQKLIVTGSSTVAPLITEIAKRFEISNPGVRIDVQTGGSSRGITDVRKNLADIGMVSRALKPNEHDLTAHAVALDGISLIVHKENPIQELSRKQLIDIYTGKLNNWKSVGGDEKEIVVINKADGRSTLEVFLSYLELKNSAVKADIVIGDNQQGLITVANNQQAISYVSIGAAAYEAENGANIRLLPIEGIEPSLVNIKNKTFPITRTLNMVTTGDLSILSKQFIQFAQSSEAHDLIKQQFLISIDAS